MTLFIIVDSMLLYIILICPIIFSSKSVLRLMALSGVGVLNVAKDRLSSIVFVPQDSCIGSEIWHAQEHYCQLHNQKWDCQTKRFRGAASFTAEAAVPHFESIGVRFNSPIMQAFVSSLNFWLKIIKVTACIVVTPRSLRHVQCMLLNDCFIFRQGDGRLIWRYEWCFTNCNFGMTFSWISSWSNTQVAIVLISLFSSFIQFLLVWRAKSV